MLERVARPVTVLCRSGTSDKDAIESSADSFTCADCRRRTIGLIMLVLLSTVLKFYLGSIPIGTRTSSSEWETRGNSWRDIENNCSAALFPLTRTRHNSLSINDQLVSSPVLYQVKPHRSRSI